MTSAVEQFFAWAIQGCPSSFPEIERIEPILAAIEGRKEFCVHSYGGYQVIDYKSESTNTFPDPQKSTDPAVVALLRECRGLIFSPDGFLCCRKFHKFFHIGQRAESMVEQIDWSEPFYILEKLDGTLVAPVPWGEHTVWTTRSGPSPIAAQAASWVEKQPVLVDAVASILSCGWTPLFEWCSRHHPIVSDSPQPRLVLTAIRHNRSGVYLPYLSMQQLAEQVGLTCVQSHGTLQGERKAKSFLQRSATQTHGEGYVLRSDDGRLFNVKTETYNKLHLLLEEARPELYGWQMALGQETTPLLEKLPSSVQSTLSQLQQLLGQAMHVRAQELRAFVDEARRTIFAENAREAAARQGIVHESGMRSDFAKGWVPRWEGEDRTLLFHVWNGLDALELLQNFLKKKLQSASGFAEVCSFLGLTSRDLLSLPAVSNTSLTRDETQDAEEMGRLERKASDEIVRKSLKKRTIIIGDIHGCLHELEGLLASLDYGGDDRLILVGDLIDHGPDSLGVIEFLSSCRREGMQVELVQGNHEIQLFEDWMRYRFRKQMEGIVEEEQEIPTLSPWIHDITTEGWAFLESAHLFYALPEFEALVVHAGIPFMRQILPLTSVLRDLARNQHRAAADMQSLRYERKEGSQIRGVRVGWEKEGDWYWAQRYDGRFGHVFYGHHPYLQEYPQSWPYATGIDLGCVNGGFLAAAVFSHGDSSPTYHTYRAKQIYAAPRHVERWADIRLGVIPMPTIPYDKYPKA